MNYDGTQLCYYDIGSKTIYIRKLTEGNNDINNDEILAIDAIDDNDTNTIVRFVKLSDDGRMITWIIYNSVDTTSRTKLHIRDISNNKTLILDATTTPSIFTKDIDIGRYGNVNIYNVHNDENNTSIIAVGNPYGVGRRWHNNEWSSIGGGSNAPIGNVYVFKVYSSVSGISCEQLGTMNDPEIGYTPSIYGEVVFTGDYPQFGRSISIGGGGEIIAIGAFYKNYYYSSIAAYAFLSSVYYYFSRSRISTLVNID